MKSSLGTLLDSGESGRFLIEDPIDPARIRLEALARGYQFVDLDCTSASDKQSFLQIARRAFSLPADFGDNWDALADCLMDLSWSGGLRWVVLARALERLWAREPDSFHTAVDILDETAQFWAEQEQPFIVLLAEDCGPEALKLPPVAGP
ncbi:MAG: barstar family protein [Betaproteobacteria bacterium]|nr:barstar family protein [Betaproteobacteria bacterium]